MNDYINRMQEEYEQLGERHGKLDAFMRGDVFKALDEENQQLMAVQRFLMYQYRTVLLSRIAKALSEN